MTLYKPPALDKAAPIVGVDGRITPYFQRFWQNLSFTAADGGSAAASIATIEAAITSINGQLSTINATLTGKAPLASPTFTGNPTAPTQAAGNNSTRLATTAYADGAVATSAATKVTKNLSTGWVAPTGTGSKATFATYTSPTISNPPTQAEVQAIADALQAATQHQKSVIDGLMTAAVFSV